MFDIFNREPVLDEESAQWLFEVYAWALKNFDADMFFNETILALPSNEYFPGHTNSVDGMANLIFDKVRDYAGMSHWPCKLVPSHACGTTAQPRIVLEGPLRKPGGLVPSIVDEAHRLTIPYRGRHGRPDQQPGRHDRRSLAHAGTLPRIPGQ